MIGPATILAYSGAPVGRDAILHFLSSWSGSSWFAAPQAFWLTLLASAVWLGWGRLRSWHDSHLAVPVLVWAFQANAYLIGALEPPVHTILIAGSLATSTVSLVIVSGMLALALAGLKRRVIQTWSLFPIALVVVGTVVLDWSFVLMCVTQVPE